MTRRGLLLCVCLLVLKTVAIGGAVRAVVNGRQARFDDARRTAVAALHAAGGVDAARWAPLVLTEAEGALREAHVAHRLASRSLLPDFSTAHTHLERVVSMARRAQEMAVVRREEARSAAGEAIQLARSTLDVGTALSSGIDLGPHRRVTAARARLVLGQADLFFLDGEYDQARVRAVRAQRLALEVSGHAAAVAARYADPDLVRTWRQWADDTIAWSRRTGAAAIIVSKADHRLILYVSGRQAAEYDVDLSYNWVADKTFAGDGATPEGRYRILAKKDRGASAYYKALLLDYPVEADRQAFASGRRAGEIPASASIGGLIEIHGEGGRGDDWTRGCVALRNADIDHLFGRVDSGTPVTIIGAQTAKSLEDLAPTALERPLEALP